MKKRIIEQVKSEYGLDVKVTNVVEESHYFDFYHIFYLALADGASLETKKFDDDSYIESAEVDGRFYSPFSDFMINTFVNTEDAEKIRLENEQEEYEKEFAFIEQEINNHREKIEALGLSFPSKNFIIKKNNEKVILFSIYDKKFPSLDELSRALKNTIGNTYAVEFDDYTHLYK